MKKTYRYKLPSGALIQVEADEENIRGAREVSRNQADKGKEIPFQQVIEPIGEIAQLVFNAIKPKVSAPDKISLEFSAALKGGSNLLLVSGETEATFKVNLTWDSNNQLERSL